MDCTILTLAGDVFCRKKLSAVTLASRSLVRPADQGAKEGEKSSDGARSPSRGMQSSGPGTPDASARLPSMRAYASWATHATAT